MNRRQLLFAGAAVTFAFPAVANLRMHGAAVVTGFNPPSVGPYSTWNGAENSGYVANVLGGVVPTNAAPGVNGQPAAKWKQPNEQILFADYIFGVDADAVHLNSTTKGVTSVTFYGDCATTVVTQQTLRTETDKRGHTKKRLGYWIKLKAAQFQAISTTGAMRIYADIAAADGSMTTRTIGRNVTDPNNGNPTDTDMRLYVRDKEFDHTYTIGPNTGAFSTLAAGITQARTDAAERPCWKFVDSVTVAAGGNLSNVTSGGSTANAKGRGVITCDPGVTVTLGMSAPFNTEVATNWPWSVGWPSVEFRNSRTVATGGDLILDMLNWCRVNVASNDQFKFSTVWNGVKITNSVINDPTKDFLGYWNGGSKPQLFAGGKYTFGTYTTTNSNCWDHFYDGVSEYQAGAPFQGTAYVVSGWKDRESIDNLFQVNAWGENCYFFNNSINPQRGGNRGIPAIIIQGPAGATVSFTPFANNQVAGSMAVKISGTPVAGSPFALGITPGGGNCYIADLAATINGLGAGWSATVLNNTIGGARLILFQDNGNPAVDPPQVYGLQGTLGLGGTGYASAPSITFGAPPTSAPLSRTATGHTVISGGVVTGIVMDDLGMGYSTANPTPPTATISGGGGSGATATTAYAATDISVSSPATFNVSKFTHSDFMIAGQNPLDNLIHRNLWIQDGYWNTALYDSVSAKNFVMRNLLGSCQGPGARGDGAFINTSNGFAASMTHMVAHFIWMDGALDIYNFQGVKTQVNCSFYAGIGQRLVSTDSSSSNPAISPNGMLYGGKFGCPFPLGSPANVFLGASNIPASYNALYVNAGGGASADFTVNPTGQLVPNLVPIMPGDEYDLFYNLRGQGSGATPGFDVPGPVAMGYTAPQPFNFATG